MIIEKLLIVENIYSIAETCLFTANQQQIIEQTHQARKFLDTEQLSFYSTSPVRNIAETAFPARPQLLAPRDMPKRSFTTVEGKIAFFHALAHIEFVAIYLAWDILYRFRGLPQQFYQDWLLIADEEAQHFTLIRQHLQELDADYGDLPAHKGLWEHAEDTSADVLARLAIVPRCMEARGLDITPQMIEKFKKQNDQDSVQLLTRILNDEIGHVQTGSYWFKMLCQQNNWDHEQKYKELIKEFFIGRPKGPFNRELRIRAGFTNAEINWLEEGA